MNARRLPSRPWSLHSRLGAWALALAFLAGALLPGPVHAQELTLSCLDGSRFSESDLERGTTIVVVWASWSPRSRDLVPRVQALAGRWGGSARVVTVSFQEDEGAAGRFLAGRNLGAPVCLDSDGAFSRKYNVATLPGLLVVKDGQVVHRGRFPDDPDRILADLLR